MFLGPEESSQPLMDAAQHIKINTLLQDLRIVLVTVT